MYVLNKIFMKFPSLNYTITNNRIDMDSPEKSKTVLLEIFQNLNNIFCYQSAFKAPVEILFTIFLSSHQVVYLLLVIYK